MANVAIFESGKTPVYEKSVNTPDYEGNADAIVNPDISAVQNTPLKYWKRNGDLVEEMTLAEKQAVDDAEMQNQKNAADTFSIELDLLVRGILKAGNDQWSKGQTVTRQEVIDWLKSQIA